ncbi:hypothetical protein [Alienimonas sp. DA493]|uniref:hypothetical protein n=1 Tax=Alienimonas sp. DA493 TaxID=3373605 RepID=UPI003754FB5E
MTSPQTAPQHADDRAAFLRRLLWAAFAVALLGGALTNGARGADRWMSRPSYFSHHVPPHLAYKLPQPVSREAYRPAWVGTQPGFSSSGAVRINRVQISAGGSVDTTVLYSQRAQFGP